MSAFSSRDVSSAPAASSGIPRRVQLEEVLELTQAMSSAANEQRWDVVAELEVRRRGLISEFFVTPAGPEEAPHLAACLQQVLALDRETIGRGEADLRELAAKIAGFDKRRQVQKAYDAGSE